MEELIHIRDVWKVFGTKSGLHTSTASPEQLERLLQDPSCRCAIRDVTLTVRKGEIFVVMGLSGSGKSTLLRMINGLITPTSGTVEIQGRSVNQMNRQELLAMRRRSMAMVFQSFALFPHRSALDNAAFGLEVSGVPQKQRLERARQALERVGLGKDLQRRPDQLSGGMRQRVGLARALALDPPILLMDEAFSALDPLIRHDMQDLLLDLQREQRRTIVFISHDLDEAVRIGDRIALMQDGRLLQCGTAEDLLCRPDEDAVQEFFSSVDPAAVLRVGAIAEAPDGDLILDLRDPNAPLLRADTLMKDAIPVVAASPRPVPVVNDEHQLVGVLTKSRLLHQLNR